MLFQHRLFVWKFSFRESKGLLNINLVFRACLLVGSFLLKLNRPWQCASNLIISTKTWRKTPIDEHVLRNTAGCYENGNPSHIFLWDLSLSHFQNFQEIVADGVTILLKQRAIVHRTILNAIPDVFMRMFWNTYTENLKNIQKNVFSVVLIPNWKFLCRYFSGSAQNFPDEFANCAFLSYVTGLQSKIPYFNKNKPLQKCFRRVLSGNSLNEGILLK